MSKVVCFRPTACKAKHKTCKPCTRELCELLAAYERRPGALPPMTVEQRKLYAKLQPILGRGAALAEALR